ncbi:MAG: hypothetical protein KAJ88_00610, partial [Candidatus Aenigmarchaeota archaeon]|nr:hypothetical protein [Candidatus Aenigmarchaeota archaeon]
DSNVECWGDNGQGKSNNYTGNDAKNPFRTYASPEPNSYTGPEQATITDSDGNYNYTIRESLGNGTYILKVNLTDPNGYYGENQTTFDVDGTPPAIAFISSTTQVGTRSQDYIEANVTATDDNMADVTIYLYNTTGLVQSCTGSTGFFHNFTDLNDGTYYLNATADDTAGNINQTDTKTIAIDATSPQIVYNSNTDSTGTYKKNWTFINITASDANKDTVLLEWNGTDETFDNNDGNYYWENKTGLSDGTYTIKVYVNDTAGNINQTETRTITIDTTPPNMTITSPENATALPAGTTQTQISITTDENATCRYNTTDSGYENSTSFTSTGNQDHSFLYTGLSGGNTYELYYWCNDSYGNINTNSTHHTFSVSSQTAYCGDGTCNNDETCSTCSSDCGSCSSGGRGSWLVLEENDTEENMTDDTQQEIEAENMTDDTVDETQASEEPKNETSQIQENARAKIDKVKIKIGCGDHLIIEDMIEEAETLFINSNYKEAYDLAVKAEEMFTEISIIPEDLPETDQSRLLYLFVLILLVICLGIYGFYDKRRRRQALHKERINAMAPVQAKRQSPQPSPVTSPQPKPAPSSQPTPVTSPAPTPTSPKPKTSSQPSPATSPQPTSATSDTSGDSARYLPASKKQSQTSSPGDERTKGTPPSIDEATHDTFKTIKQEKSSSISDRLRKHITEIDNVLINIRNYPSGDSARYFPTSKELSRTSSPEDKMTKGTPLSIDEAARDASKTIKQKKSIISDRLKKHITELDNVLVNIRNEFKDGRKSKDIDREHKEKQ